MRRTKTSDRCRQMCRMRYQLSQCVSRSDRLIVSYSRADVKCYHFVLEGRCAMPCHARGEETVGTSAGRCRAQTKAGADPCVMCTSELHTAVYYLDCKSHFYYRAQLKHTFNEGYYIASRYLHMSSTLDHGLTLVWGLVVVCLTGRRIHQ